MKSLNKIDIVLSMFNQEKLITKVLQGIIDNTTTKFNLILVFDGCTDKTMEVATSFLKANRPPLLDDLRIATAANVYETRANNIGFKMSTEPYLITLQDDMVIEEKGWERRLTYPIRAFDDVFAVTARSALNTCIDPKTLELRYLDEASRESFTLDRKTFTIRNSINRGPIAFRTDTLIKLGYLDEAFAPGWLDEADIVLRAHERFGMVCGAFWIGYRSDEAWGKTRSKSSSMNASNPLAKNTELLLERHPVLGKLEQARIIQSRKIIDSSIDYVKRDHAPKRLWIACKAKTYYASRYISRRLNGLKVRLKNNQTRL